MKSIASAARVLTQSLAGRVLLIILAGLIVAHAASFALFVVERSRAVDRFAAADMAARVLDQARAGAQPQRPREALRMRLRWNEVSHLGERPADSEEPSTTFTAELRRVLAEGLGSDPVVWLGMRESPGATFSRRMPPRRDEDAGMPWPAPPGLEGNIVGRRFAGPEGGPGLRGEKVLVARGALPERNPTVVTAALRLPDGRNVRVESLVFRPSTPIPAQAWLSVLLLLIVTAAFSIWAVQLAVRPLRMLADAAERLSRNLDEPPLAEKGPGEIRAASRAFNRMQDRLRRHVAGRTLAFAAMSHDIRTPLTRLRLKLEAMDPRTRARIEDDIAEIDGIARSVLQMARDLSPEEALVAVDLEDLAARLAAGYAALGTRVPVSGRCAPVQARPAALRRALGNLIDNALKYGEQVSIELLDSPSHATVRICDRGPGIPGEHLQRVMEPFYRVEPSRSRDTGGSGLGLAIARDIVEGHGGELRLENRAEGGLCATLLLPR